MNLLCPNISELVSEEHAYRKMLKVLDLNNLTRDLQDCYKELGRKGYPVESGFKALLLQFIEDISDRELERFLQENLAGKLFCGFELKDPTPDYSYFSVLRKRIGTERLAKLFNKVRYGMKRRGVIKEVFSFVDASTLVSKLSTWEERDKAIKAGMERFNNETAHLFAADHQARFGCKGKDKYWFGYKRHVCVDMSHGLISKVAVTPADVTDQSGLKHICPKQGMVFGDKAYSLGPAQLAMQKRGCHSGAILRNNMLGKDFRRDKWLNQVRMPFEGVFSKMSKKARYRGIAKTQFQAFMQAFAFNLKRLVAINAPPINGAAV